MSLVLDYDTFIENTKKAMEEMRKSFLAKVRSDVSYADEVAEFIYDRLVDDLMMEVVMNIHRAKTLGYLRFILHDSDDEEEVPPTPTVEVESDDINCPKCKKVVNASRFTPHLEKCMGLGRSSSRIASQRIAANHSSGAGSEETNSWSVSQGRNSKKTDTKRKREPARRGKGIQDKEEGTSSKN